MLKTILWIISLYFLYRFIVGFVIPVWKVTSKVKKQVRDFQSQVNQHQAGPQQPHHQTTTPAPKAEGDYIEFEEVK